MMCEYFEAIVIRKNLEIIKKVVKRGFWKWRTKTEVEETRYFIVCDLGRFEMKIAVEKEVYMSAFEGAKLSICLRFEYMYMSPHFIPYKLEKNIYDV